MADKIKRKAATRRDREDARRLQAAGTHGDTILAHINPEEARLLDKLADGLLDGGGRNPTTGLLSFGMSDGEAGGFGGSSGQDSNPGGVGGGPAGGQTGGGIGGNTSDGQGGLGGGYGNQGYQGSVNQKRAEELGNYYRDTYINGLVDNPYAPKDTWMRVVQELFNPSVPANKYGPTTGTNLGIMGTAVGKLAGGPMSAMMGIGEAMGRAQSPASQAASMAESQARGSQNSTGQDRDSHTGLDFASLDARAAGSASGAQTATLNGQPQTTVPPGYKVNPAGQIVPDGTSSRNNTLTGLSQPVESLLADYIFRGRGGGLLGW